MIAGTPLEDARHLAQRYSRMRQEAEAQVSRCIYASEYSKSSFNSFNITNPIVMVVYASTYPSDICRPQKFLEGKHV